MSVRFTQAVLIVAVLLAGCSNSPRELATSQQNTHSSDAPIAGSSTAPPQAAPPANATSDASMPAYDIVDRDRYDAPIKTQLQVHTVVSGPVTEIGLKQLLRKLYDEANATRGFKHHGGKPTHVFVYVYQSREHFESGMGQWIAMLSRAGESAAVETHVKTDLIAHQATGPEVKHGLSEPKRKEVFTAICEAEDRADAESQQMYPLPDVLSPNYSQAQASAQLMKQAEAFNDLAKKYKAEVAKRYGITDEQLSSIVGEGLERNWPMP